MGNDWESLETTADILFSDAWLQVGAEDDPFASHRPDPVLCAGDGFLIEDTVVEVDTDTCNYVTLTQPIDAKIGSGDQIDALLWHSLLYAYTEDDVSAHVAIYIGEHPLFDQLLPLPQSASVYDIQVTATFEAPAGTPAYLHVHNHGSNTYDLGYVRVTPNPSRLLLPAE